MTRNGLSVIFISHKLREVLAFSNRIAVLRHGKKVGEISSKEADERKIARLMVGEDTKISSRKKIKVGEPVLELNNLTISGSSKRESISNINLSVNKHEILGGSVPQDNPFKNRGELAKTFWTTGHRNALGLAFDQIIFVAIKISSIPASAIISASPSFWQVIPFAPASICIFANKGDLCVLSKD